MSRQINRINDKTLEQSILIIPRDNYIDNFIEELLKPDCRIIPIEYINENIRLEFLKNKMDTNIIINDKIKTIKTNLIQFRRRQLKLCQFKSLQLFF